MNASHSMEIVLKIATTPLEVTFVRACLVTTLLQIQGLALVRLLKVL